MHITVYIAVSVDGFIAREDGGLDWLPTGEAEQGEDYGYAALMDSVDALVMGRSTYEAVRTFGAWPYGGKPVVVLTTRPLEIPAALAGSVSSLCGTPQEIVQTLAAQGRQHLYVDGGRTIQRFLRAGLVDTLILTRIPVLLGGGRPLFGALPRDLPLRHLGTTQYASGLVQSRYAVGGRG